MPSNHSQPTYVAPCVRKTSGSIESEWLMSSDFGECYVRPSDTELYPCLVPVYNGQVLNINTELVHSSLSGISVKHYYGKCYREMTEEELEEEVDYDMTCGGLYTGELFGSDVKLPSMSSRTSWRDQGMCKEDSMEDFEDPSAHLPICLRQKINYRNSFWNVHRPELCKLTWPQKYVSSVTVAEHLHSHLVAHGSVCGEYHDEAGRAQLLEKELNEYGKLKVLAHPRELPPDEKPFDFFDLKTTATAKTKTCPDGPRCKTFPRRKPIETESKFIILNDDEDGIAAEGKAIHLSKGEFCMTIGRHIRKPPIKMSVSEVEEIYGMDEAIHYPGEEESGFFFYNWQNAEEEEGYEGTQGTDDSSTIDLEPVPMAEPCPVLGMSDFCRTVAKADFSDLRCHPDDF